MRFKPLVFCLALALALCPAISPGDTIILKSGEKLDGRIVSETDQEATIEFKATPTITDTRTVAKSEIEKIEKVAPDEIAFQAIKNLKPGANSLAVSGYDAIIKALQAFVVQYPESSHVNEVAPQLTAFAEEKARVEGGEIKLDGKWISKEEVEKERYQLSGRALLAQMQDQNRRGDYVGALNTFAPLEKNFPGSSAFPDAVDLAVQTLIRLKAQAERALQTWQVQKKERDASTQLSAEPQRSQLIAEQKREQTQYDAAIEAASKASSPWPPFIARSEKSLTAISVKIPAEAKRLDALPVAKMKQSIPLAEATRGLLEKNDFEAAESSLKQSLALWNTNELALRLQKELTAQKSIMAKATPVPEATPPPATPQATPKPKPATPVGSTKSAPVEEEKAPLITPFRIVVTLVLLVIVGLGLMAYRKIKRKANEILE